MNKPESYYEFEITRDLLKNAEGKKGGGYGKGKKKGKKRK
jgi:hypothetical protein